MIESYGTDWSDTEIDLVVADYFAMLASECTGEAYSKAEHNEALQQLVQRSRKAIEFKHCNISAVLERLGIQNIRGYRPLHHYQNALVAGVERYLVAFGEPVFATVTAAPNQLAETATLWFGQPPSTDPAEEKAPDPLRKLIQRFDPAARDARNRKLGKEGEALIYKFEQERLTAAGRSDLAAKIEWTSEVRGDGAGYDISSFEEDGTERLIEIKTTNGPAKTPFFLSENERCVSEARKDVFQLIRLYNFAKTPSAFKLRPPWKDSLMLHPQSYRATLL